MNLTRDVQVTPPRAHSHTDVRRDTVHIRNEVGLAFGRYDDDDDEDDYSTVHGLLRCYAARIRIYSSDVMDLTIG